MAQVLKSDDNKIMVLDSGFVASYENGQWVSGARFDTYQLNKDFYNLDDEKEVQEVVKQARNAVRPLATA